MMTIAISKSQRCNSSITNDNLHKLVRSCTSKYHNIVSKKDIHVTVARAIHPYVEPPLWSMAASGSRPLKKGFSSKSMEHFSLQLSVGLTAAHAKVHNANDGVCWYITTWKIFSIFPSNLEEAKHACLAFVQLCLFSSKRSYSMSWLSISDFVCLQQAYSLRTQNFVQISRIHLTCISFRNFKLGFWYGWPHEHV